MPRLIIALLGLAALTPNRARASEGATAPSGEARLASGPTAHYAYHYDRNALRDSRLAGDALVALTRSGNLLRFDAKTLKLTGEWFGPVAASRLGPGEGDSILVGFEDGRVCRVDPKTLALAEVARLPDRVQWIAHSRAEGGRGGLVAVVEPAIVDKRTGYKYRGGSIIHDLVTGRTFPLPPISVIEGDGFSRKVGGQPSAIFLDRRRRLWLGGDQGEWGGWLVRADLDLGRVEPVEGVRGEDGEIGGWAGIYGFAERPDGQVWAFGGTMHMGLAGGFFTRIDRSLAQNLYTYGNDDDRGEDGRMIPARKPPYLPTTHVLDDGDGKLTVIAYSDIYRVDLGLKDWSKVHSLKIRYRWGRPDAVGAYPSVVAAHQIDGRFVCATGIDGYVTVADGKETSHALPGQFGLDRTWRIAGSAEGVLCSPQDDRLPTWRLGDGGWEVADLAPPCERVQGDLRFGNDEGKPTWAETRVMVGPGGTVYTVSATNGSGTRTTARRLGGKAEVLGRESSDLDVSYSFITPDGALWNARNGDLKQFINGRWEGVVGFFFGERTGKPTQLSDQGFWIGDDLRVIGDAGPPWVLFDNDQYSIYRDHPQLFRLAYGPNFKDPKLDAIRLVEGGHPLKVRDATPGGKGELLIATDKGLRRLDVASGKVEPSSLPVPDRPVTALARDGLGRVWMAGEGLWVVDADGKRLHDCGPLPMIGRTEVATIAADQDHRDGVIVSLGERGVVFVRVSDGAAR